MQFAFVEEVDQDIRLTILEGEEYGRAEVVEMVSTPKSPVAIVFLVDWVKNSRDLSTAHVLTDTGWEQPDALSLAEALEAVL